MTPEPERPVSLDKDATLRPDTDLHLGQGEGAARMPDWLAEAAQPSPSAPSPGGAAYAQRSATAQGAAPSANASNSTWPTAHLGGVPTGLPADISTRKLVAGLLAILLGSFGAHKFYLGLTNPGLMMLLVNVGGWFVTLVFSLLTLGVGALFLVPLMSLVSSAIGIVGLIEGIVYLTKTDQDFYQTYLVDKKPWF